MRERQTFRQKGFTLIEALVATSVFAFVISSIVGVYLSTIQVDRKTRSIRAVTQNARFITEFLTKEIRNGLIDYSSYSGGVVPANNIDLYVVNDAGELEHFFPSASSCTAAAPCDLRLIKAGFGAVNLNSSTVKITNFKFFILPSSDPFAGIGGSIPNEQPRVTVVLELTSNYGPPGSIQNTKLNIQTTIGLRTYPPRE